jgi:hypothetical protein
MGTNKPTSHNARKGAVKKRSQTKTIMGDATIWTKRDKTSGELRAIKKATKNDGKESRAEEIAAAKKKAAKKTTLAKSSRVSSREKVRRCSLGPTFSAL